MESFVIAIISRLNRVTNLAPNKVTKADVPGLVSSRAEQSLKLVRRPKLYADGYVKIVNVDISFCKDYKKLFTDEVSNIPTQNLPTCNLIDTNRDLMEELFTSLNHSRSGDVGIINNHG